MGPPIILPSVAKPLPPFCMSPPRVSQRVGPESPWHLAPGQLRAPPRRHLPADALRAPRAGAGQAARVAAQPQGCHWARDRGAIASSRCRGCYSPHPCHAPCPPSRVCFYSFSPHHLSVDSTSNTPRSSRAAAGWDPASPSAPSPTTSTTASRASSCSASPTWTGGDKATLPARWPRSRWRRNRSRTSCTPLSR